MGQLRQAYAQVYKINAEEAERFDGVLFTTIGQAIPALTISRLGLPAAAIPLQFQGFQYSLDDAEETARRNGQAFDPNQAYKYAATMGTVNSLLNFIKADKALAPWLKTNGPNTLYKGAISALKPATVVGGVSAVQGGINDAGATVFGIEDRNIFDPEKRAMDFAIGLTSGGFIAGSGALIRFGSGIRFTGNGGPYIPIVSANQPKAKTVTEARNWIKAALVGKEIDAPSLKGVITISNATALKMTSASATKKSTSPEAHIAAIEFIPDLAAVAIAESFPDRSADPNIAGIHRLYAPLVSNGQLYRVKMTVKEYATGDKSNRLYSIEAVEIEVPAWSSTEVELGSVHDAKLEFQDSAYTAHAGLVKLSDLLPESTKNSAGRGTVPKPPEPRSDKASENSQEAPLPERAKQTDSTAESGTNIRDESGRHSEKDSSTTSGENESDGHRSQPEIVSKSRDVSSVEGMLTDIQSKWGSTLDTVVHPSIQEISDENLRKAALQEGDVEGFFNPNDGKIHIMADRVRNAADAERLLRHEGLHWAFAGPLKKQYAAVIEKVGREIPWERMQEIIAKYPKGDVTLWIEEYLAARGEKNPDFSLRRRFFAKVREILRGVFGDRIKFSDAELDEFLYKANRRLERARESDSQHFDAPDEGADPLYAKDKPKGPQRASWDEVRKGDRWNSVKNLLPKGTVSHDLFPEHGDKDAVVGRAANFLSANSVVADWTGRTVYLPYGQTKGGYHNKLLNRAEHVVCYDEAQGSHNRKLDSKKIKWLAAVPTTIREAAARIRTEKAFLYFKAYKDGVHMVVTSPEGVLLDQDVYDSGLVTQFPVYLRSMDFKGAVVDAIRH